MMNRDSRVRRSDLCPLSYAEFGALLDTLTATVRAFRDEGGRPIDIVAPILRSGAATGTHLASRLGIQRMLPVQYKYDARGAPTRIFEPPRLDEANASVRGILLADTNTVRGAIATCAAADLRARFPDASIYLASVVVDCALSAIASVDGVFFAVQSNEARSVDREEARARGVSDAVWIFPWEDPEEQWREILATQ
jgi:hypothetical protein